MYIFVEEIYNISFRGTLLNVEMIKRINKIIVFEDLFSGELIYAPEAEIKAISKEDNVLFSLTESLLFSIKTDYIEAIISREELKLRYSELDSNSVLISIRNPDKEKFAIDYFKKSLFIDFWDVETDIDKNHPFISNKTAMQIKEFI